jgi:hypothetical protein
MFGALEEYRHANGHCNGPQRYNLNPKLGYWVTHQRQSYKKGKLAAERIAKLDSLGFQWSALQEQEQVETKA